VRVHFLAAPISGGIDEISQLPRLAQIRWSATKEMDRWTVLDMSLKYGSGRKPKWSVVLHDRLQMDVWHDAWAEVDELSQFRSRYHFFRVTAAGRVVAAATFSEWDFDDEDDLPSLDDL
jgi:hypothetical protein